jgi:hypothetical protein
VTKGKTEMRKIVIAACIAGSLGLAISPASAQYRRYQRPDQGEAITLEMFGLATGAIAATQAPPSAYYGAPQDEYNSPSPPPIYYEPPNSYDPQSFGPTDCAAGFYDNGERCVAD